MVTITKLGRRVSRIFASLVLMTAQMTPFFVFSGSASAEQDNDKVRICHATNSANHPYVEIEVAKSAVDGLNNDNGNGDHFLQHTGVIATSIAVAQTMKSNGQQWGDIIPPVSPHHNGLNWQNGEDIHDNDCVVSGDKTTVTVKKVVINGNVNDRFNLKAESDDDTVTANAVGNNGSTSVMEISDRKDLEVSETAGNQTTSLSSYTTTIVCSNHEGIVGQNSPTDSTKRKIEIDSGDIDKGDDIECVITNTAKTGKLKVVKEIVDGGIGTKTLADFTFTVNGGSSQAFTPVDLDTGSSEMTLPLGTTYNVVEPQANSDDYVTTYSGCSQVTLVNGQTKTCTITNTYQKGRVIVNKTVVNDDGGTLPASSFTVNVGNQSSAFTNTGEGTGTATFFVTPGATNVSEETVAGYLPTYAKDCAQGVMNVAARETVICDITNNDQPGSITLIKTVKNDDGGKKEVKDFDLYVQQGDSPKVDVESGISLILKAGSYKASENQLPGYESAGWTGDCDLSGNFTVALGQAAVCYIINDDQPGRIIVHKEVINDNGGEKDADDFRFRVNNGQWEYFNSYGFNEIEVNAGWYTVGEYEDDAYKASYKDCYRIYVKNGETKHCFIKNDDKAPEVKVMKWTNPHWSSQNFNFTIRNNENTKNFTLDGHPYDDQTSSYYETSKYLQAGVVEITESESEGWFQESVRCYVVKNWGLYPIPHPIKAELGKKYVCKFINTQYGRIEITKFHDYDEDGEWDEGEPALPDWEMNLEGREREDDCEVDLDVSAIALFDQAESDVLPDCGYDDESDSTRTETTGENGVAVFEDVTPGEKYELSETLKDGWTQSSIFCEDDRGDYELSRQSREHNDEEDEDENDNSVWVGVQAGETAECYVGNYRRPVVDIVKTNSTTSPVNRGAEITFTLKITVPGPATSGLLQGSSDDSGYLPVVVTDNMNDELDYVAGSFTANSSVRGDLKAAGITTDPNYASPGLWNLTTLASNIVTHGEVITLTYKAKVGPTTPAGTYTTVASVKGYGDDVSVTATDSDDDKIVVVIPAVLGSSTTKVQLASTGSNQYLSILSGIMFVIITVWVLKKSSEE